MMIGGLVSQGKTLTAPDFVFELPAQSEAVQVMMVVSPNGNKPLPGELVKW